MLDIDKEIATQAIPVSAQGIYRRALSGNRPAAVKAMCLACQGWEDGARQAIRDCPSVGCPLHAVRPFQKKAGNIDTSINIDIDEDEATTDTGTTGINVGKAEISGPIIDLAMVKSKILDHLHRKGESQRGYIIFASGIPESLWNEAIRSLLSEGKVERQGEKRNTRYRLKEE